MRWHSDRPIHADPRGHSGEKCSARAICWGVPSRVGHPPQSSSGRPHVQQATGTTSPLPRGSVPPTKDRGHRSQYRGSRLSCGSSIGNPLGARSESQYPSCLAHALQFPAGPSRGINPPHGLDLRQRSEPRCEARRARRVRSGFARPDCGRPAGYPGPNGGHHERALPTALP